MHLETTQIIQVALTGPEVRLVGLALSGNLKDPADIAAAAELNGAILARRRQSLEQAVAVVTAAMTKAAKDKERLS